MGCRQLAHGVLVLLPSTGVLAFLPLLLGAWLGEKSQPVLLGRKQLLRRGEAGGHPVELRDVRPHWSGLSPPGPGASLHFATSSITYSSWPRVFPGCDHSGLHLDCLWGSGLGALVLQLDFTLPVCAEGQGPVALLVPQRWDTFTRSFPTRARMPPDVQTSRELPLSVVLTLTFSSCQPIGGSNTSVLWRRTDE